MKRLSCFMLLVLFLAVLAVPLRASPPIGAVVQTWHYDAQKQTVTLRIVNTSHRDITGYCFTMTEKLADGTSQTSERSTDLLEGMLIRGGGFLAGTSRDEIVPALTPVIDVITTLDVVAYADGTADVINERAFKDLLGLRKANVVAAQTISGVLTKASTPEAAKAEFSRLTAVLNAKGHTANTEEESWADTALHMHLQTAASGLTLENMKDKAKKYGDLATAIAPHTQLVKGVQP